MSTDPAHKPDIRRAAEFTADLLRKAGMENVRLIEGEGHPLVYGDWLHAAGRPTLLFYGHYDVQPPDPLEEWKSPPFEPEIRGDNIYARGAADDKGLLLILIKAAERIMQRDSRLPVNARFLIEGEEEIGGEHIASYVGAHADRLSADAAVICDTEMFAPELPTICVGLRGIVYGELHVSVAEQDMHSGVWGGAVANPIQAIAEILCSLKDRDGHITIPGFYDRVRPPAAAEREAWSRLPLDEDRWRTQEAKVFAFTGEPEVSLLDRVWARPTLEVHGIRGGFTGEGAKTVIPARAVAKLSMRLVADQTPETAIEQLKAAVAHACPRGVRADFHSLHGAPPSLVDPDNPFIRKAAEAMEAVFGNPTVYTRSGGSIPIVGLFDKHLKIPSVMMGFGLPDDNLHAPNEKLYLPNFYRGIDAVERYLLSLSTPD